MEPDQKRLRLRQREVVDWRAYLDAGVTESQLATIRRSTYSGRRWARRSLPACWEKRPSAAWRHKNADPRKKPIGARTRRHFPWCLVDHLSRSNQSSILRWRSIADGGYFVPSECPEPPLLNSPKVSRCHRSRSRQSGSCCIPISTQVVPEAR
jgi:hypothetical protein